MLDLEKVIELDDKMFDMVFKGKNDDLSPQGQATLKGYRKIYGKV